MRKLELRLRPRSIKWLTICLLVVPFGIGPFGTSVAYADSKKDVATPPTAAGTSPQTPKPFGIQQNGSVDDSEPAVPFNSAEGTANLDANTSDDGDAGLPEPFLCEFTWRKSKKNPAGIWENTGSEYPRIGPPISKHELLTRPFSRVSNFGKGPSWGLCSEIIPNQNFDELMIELFAHSSKVATDPTDSADRCRWKSKGLILSGKHRIALRIGIVAGIEFQNDAGDRIRFSAHWPRKSESDLSGEACRRFAQGMNEGNAKHAPFTKITLHELK